MPWFIVECYARDGTRSDQRVEAPDDLTATERAQRLGFIVGAATPETSTTSLSSLPVCRNPPRPAPSPPARVSGLTVDEQLLAELQFLRATIDRSSIPRLRRAVFWSALWAILCAAIVLGIIYEVSVVLMAEDSVQIELNRR